MSKHSSTSETEQSSRARPPTQPRTPVASQDVTFRLKTSGQTGARPTAHAGLPQHSRSSPQATTQHSMDKVRPDPLIGLGWARARTLRQLAAHGSYGARQRSRRRVWLWRAVVILVLVSLLIVGLRFLFHSTYFQIHHLLIEHTTNAQLIASIQALHLTGGNIFLTDTGQDAARIKALPPVADASVTRNLPDTLVVSLVERQPVLIWQVGKQDFSLDAQGVIIAQVQPPTGLPLVSDEHQRDAVGNPFGPGEKVDPAIVEMARQLLERLPTEVGITTFSLHDTLEYGLVVISAAGWQARFGNPQDLDNKIKELAAIVQLVNGQKHHLALVDLRFGFYPYYRLDTSGASG